MPTVDIISPGGAFTPAAVGNGVTDDAPAFRAFNTWAQAQVSPITLTLGSGSKTFLFSSSDSNNQRLNSPAFKVSQPLTIIGNGPTTSILKSASGFFLGGQSSIKSGNGNFGSSSIFTARLSSVSAGSTTVQCKTIADALLFSDNSWSLITGLDMMGAFSTPANPFWYEFVYITNVNITTGVITFQSPLANTYLETWPLFSAGTPGLQPDRAGPATLYVLDSQWDINATYQDLGVDSGSGQAYASGRIVNFTNVKWTGTGGMTPSVNSAITFTNCDLTSYTMEVDKLIEQMTFDSTTTGTLNFQSSVKDVVVRNNSVINALNGTPRNLTISNSTVSGFFVLGATGFGRTDSFISSGSTFSGSYGRGGVTDTGDATGALQTDYTMSSGVIRMPKSGLTYGCRWAIPGTYCCFTGGVYGFGPTFKVTSVTEDGTYIYVRTSMNGGFPSWATGIKVLASLNVQLAANTSSPTTAILTQMAASALGYSRYEVYTSKQFNGSNLGNFGTGNDTGIDPVSGRVLSITINVSTAYTGAQGSLLWRLGGQFDLSTIIKPDLTTATWAPRIDLKTPGTRVIRPSGVTGSTGSDANLTLPDSAAWLSRFLISGICANNDITAEYAGNNGVGPVVTLTAITDQGFIPDAVMPLRFRLRAS